MKNYTPAQFLAMHKAQISAPFPKVAVDLDEERFFEPGGEGEAIAAGMGYSRCYEDEMDPELVAYWASYDKGLKKEIHHGNSGQRAASLSHILPCPPTKRRTGSGAIR